MRATSEENAEDHAMIYSADENDAELQRLLSDFRDLRMTVNNYCRDMQTAISAQGEVVEVYYKAKGLDTNIIGDQVLMTTNEKEVQSSFKKKVEGFTDLISFDALSTKS